MFETFNAHAEGVFELSSASASFVQQQVAANCAEIIAFVEERLPNDPLIKGVPDDKNPYKGDKGGCVIT